MEKKQLDTFGTFLRGVKTVSSAQVQQAREAGPSEAGEVKISKALLQRLLEEGGPVAVSALYKASGLSLLELARLIADMEQFGLVQKAWLDTDEELVSLTSAGEKFARAATESESA